MNVQQIIEKQGWTKQRENNGFLYYFEKDTDTLKIFLANSKANLEELKNELWNTYYSRVLIYKQDSNRYKIWTNNQSPESEGDDFDDKSFNEEVSPIEYWDTYITKTSKNTVDKKLEESILIVFRKLKYKYSNQDDLISIILACTFIRFLEDRNLTDVSDKLINVLSSKKDAVNLFKTYNDLHNGMLFKQHNLDDETCQTLQSLLKANLFNNQESFFHFDFKYIPIELISNIYEKLLTEKLGKEQKKSQGIAYTPPKLANYLTKESFKQLDQKISKKDFSKIKIGDLSTGSGIFLVLSFRELLKRITSPASFEEKKKILEESFYGIDLDQSAINITAFSLYVELLGKNKGKKLASNNKFPILKNIKKQNALSYSKCSGFFDLIIGNPPWGSFDRFEEIKDTKWAKDVANRESAQIFVNVGIDKLKDGGILALVLPSASFYNSRSFHFRNSLLKNTIIKEFVDFSSIRSHVFKNHVEASIVIGEKNNQTSRSYTIPMRRVVNEADYLYFNHISGNTNDIDSNFLQSRDDSWQIAIRGGNMAALFIDRLENNFISLKKNKKIFIGTGYQSTKKGENITVSKNYSEEFNKKIYLIEKGQIIQKYTNLKKSGKSHILFNEKFYKDSLGVANSYKYNQGLITKYFEAGADRVISGDFNLITGDKNALYFIVSLLHSRLGEFLINLRGAKTSLLGKERQNPKIFKQDIEKLFIPYDYNACSEIINIGKKIAHNSYGDSLDNINKKIESIYKINKIEKETLNQWEKITGRQKMGDRKDRIQFYQRGFEYMLNSYNLPKPKKWGEPEIISGVEVISFSETMKQPAINRKIKQKIKDIIIAKKDMDFEFISDSQGIVIRREKNNYGFLTGLLDAELILSNL